MVSARFKVGERIQARSFGTVPAGTRGDIRVITHTTPPQYLVRFDEAGRHLVQESDIEQISDVPRRRWHRWGA